MSAEKENVLRKVRKMLALHNDNSASEGERDNALRMAHATLAKYNLNLSDAEKKEDERIDSAVEFSPHAWARTAAMAVADLFFCEYFFFSVGSSQRIKHYFIGRESNVITAQEMAKYVVKSISSQARKETKRLFEDGKFERDFCKGASEAIYIRCKEIRASAEKEDSEQFSSTRTDIVLSSLYKTEKEENAFVIAEKYNLEQSNVRQSSAGIVAFEKGKQFGNSINLNKQLTENSNTRRTT